MKKNTVLVVAAHPDDEVLGCGGTIAVHAARGDDVHILIMAEGITSRDRMRDEKARDGELSELADTAKKVGLFLGAKSVDLLCFPDNRMDSLPLLDIIKEVEARLERIKPNIVYTHHHADLNVDHQITHQAVITACRPYPEQMVNMILFFEVPSSTDWQTAGNAIPFAPNWFVDISKSLTEGVSPLEKKLQTLKSYESEMHAWPHSRSIEAVKHLAKHRGASCGISAAEAFMLGRKIS